MSMIMEIQLTELEYCVLALIWRIQPCTAYAVRRIFQNSLTASWRASTGSIYPLLKKLAAKGLLSETQVEGDRRNARLLTIEPPGESAVRSWLEDMPPWLGSPVADPIRTRGHLLLKLDSGTQAKLVAKWRHLTEESLAAVRHQLSHGGVEEGPIEPITLRGTELQLLARIQWLDEIDAALKGSGLDIGLATKSKE